MAKRMQFSVVGLPHYTIWHLYEPSVDDIKHMEVSLPPLLYDIASPADVLLLQEMEKERLAKEAEEKAKAEKEKKIKEEFGDSSAEWEKDKSEIQNLAKEESQKGSSEELKREAAEKKTSDDDTAAGKAKKAES